MIYLDANIFVHALIGSDEKSQACLAIIEKIIKKEQDGGTSLLSWDEFFHVLKKEIGRERAVEEGQLFLNMPNLTFFKVDKEVISKAQSLAEIYALDPRDAIHAATAILNGIKEIATDDSDFDKIKELKRIKPTRV